MDLYSGKEDMLSIRDEFRPRNFGFGYHPSDVFYQSQWCLPPAVFLAYRIFVSLYACFWLFTASTVWYGHRYPVPVWLTYWSFGCLCCHLVLAAVITIIHTKRSRAYCCSKRAISRDNIMERKPIMGSNANGTSRKNSSKTEDGIVLMEKKDVHCSKEKIALNRSDSDMKTNTWYMKIDWLLYNIACPYAFLVTIVYFYKVYPGIAKRKNLSFPEADDFHIHAVNSIIVVTEVLLAALPVRLLHMIYPVLFGLLYMSATAIFWAVDHTHILYNGMIDWNRPGRTLGLAAIMGLVVVPVVHTLLFGAYKLRTYVFYRLHNRNVSTYNVDLGHKQNLNAEQV